MRIVLALLTALLLPASGSLAAPGNELTAPEQALGWIKGYRSDPQPDAVPRLVKDLAAVGAFQEPEGAGVYVGFMAGVLGANPDKARDLVRRMAEIPAADQWAVVKAIAYSRLPHWRNLMAISSEYLPERGTMIDAYLTGKLAGFDRYRMEAEKPSIAERARDLVRMGKEEDDEAYLEPGPAILDTLWGYYFATGSPDPLNDIAALVRWSQNGNDLARLTMGSSAKYSLAANASRDAELLGALRRVRANLDPELAELVDEAIFAAEVSETGRLREEAAEAVTTLREKGPAYLRKVAWWGRAGEGAIALGCVAAAATGQVYLGVPCVIGGAVTSAVLRYVARSG